MNNQFTVYEMRYVILINKDKQQQQQQQQTFWPPPKMPSNPARFFGFDDMVSLVLLPLFEFFEIGLERSSNGTSSVGAKPVLYLSITIWLSYKAYTQSYV